MSEENNGPRDGNNRRNQDPQFNWRGFLLFAVAGALFLSALVYNSMSTMVSKVSFPEFKELVAKKVVLGTTKFPLVINTSDTTRKETISGFYFESPEALETAQALIEKLPSQSDMKSVLGPAPPPRPLGSMCR